jgi:hypothetical protein
MANDNYPSGDRTVTIDHFDRLIGTIDGLPNVTKSRPSTVTTVLPLIGLSQTFVVQSYKDADEGFYVFLQMVDAEGRARIALPPKVTAAIYRQQDALIRRSRRQAGRDRWDRMSEAEQDAHVTRLRKARGA